METKPEEIALIERAIAQEIKPINGHLKTQPTVKFTCPTPPDEKRGNRGSSDDADTNGTNLSRKLSRSASHIESFSHSLGRTFEGNRNRFGSGGILEITPEIRKISSSEGDLIGKEATDSLLHPKQTPLTKSKNQGSIFDIAFPSVPSLRQTSINPGQKVAQVCGL